MKLSVVKKFTFTKIDVEEVMSAYFGKEGCRCGCLGKYYYNEMVEGKKLPFINVVVLK